MLKAGQETATTHRDVTPPWPAQPSSEIQELRGPSLDRLTGPHLSSDVKPTTQTAYPQITDVQVTLPGNPEVGVIHHIANQHGSRHGQDFHELKNLSERNVGVMRRLRELGVQHCFLEGCQAGHDITTSVAVQKSLNEAFPRGELPLTPDKKQTLLLAQNFADCLRHFFPNMSFHGTEPPPEAVTAADHPATPDDVKQDLVFSLRERCAFESILQLLAKLEPEKKTVALIYGCAHSWEPKVLGENGALDESPRVIKETFQPWSSYKWTRELEESTTAKAQIGLLQPDRRYFSWVWWKLHSPEVQLMALPHLKPSLDWDRDPMQLTDTLISGMKAGNEETRTKLVAAIHAHREAHSGPFADLFIRPGGDEALQMARGRFAALTIWDETHALTQLECVRVASSIEDFAFCRMMTATAQLAALPKLVLSGASQEDSVNQLLRAAVNATVEKDIVRRSQNGEAPFTRG